MLAFSQAGIMCLIAYSKAHGFDVHLAIEHLLGTSSMLGAVWGLYLLPFLEKHHLYSPQRRG